MNKDLIPDFLSRLSAAYKDVKGATKLLWNSSTVLSRFEGVGILTQKDVRSLGLIGVPARSTGMKRDIRKNFAEVDKDIYSDIEMVTNDSGDVYGRAVVRDLEINESYNFIKNKIVRLPEEEHFKSPKHILKKETLTLSLVEGWRGEICHVAITDNKGKFACYKIYDPSFHNWMGLSIAMRGEQVSDFPLCNKSFNLSYCGFDL